MRHLNLDIDNESLVKECISGDRDAMSIFYSRFAPRMLRVISRYVPDRDSANDILHDGFIAAFTRLDTLHDANRLEFWLATIMKNLSLKFLQAQSIFSILEEIPETVEEPELEDLLDFATIEALILQLPEGYRKVFRLAVLEGKSHKEISEILGIAPNTSSSQLFHAKLRLRQLIKDHKLRAGLISLLLLIVASGILFLDRDNDKLDSSEQLAADSTNKTTTSTADCNSGTSGAATSENAPSPANANAAYTSIPTFWHKASVKGEVTDGKVTDDGGADDALPAESSTLSTFSSDSIGVSSPCSNPENKPMQPLDDRYDYSQDRLFAEMPPKAYSDKGWDAGISIDPGMFSFNGMIQKESDSNLSEQPPVDPDDDATDSSTPSRIARSAQGIESYLSSASRRHYLPISFALSAEKHFSSRIGLETGMAYSYLHTDFERNGSVSTCHWHYLEIPLKVNFYAYTSPRMKLYLGLGGRVSIPVYSYAQIASNPYCRSGRFESKAVWSAGVSAGASFRLSKRMDLYIEPSLRYHFPQECKIPNIWTDDEPWTLSIPIGFRFNW